MMGFMNFSLGLGLMFLCFAMWLHADKEGAGPAWLAPFALTVLLLTFTHPVPLLMLLLLCGYDLLTLSVCGRKARPIRSRVLAARLSAMIILCCALAYPVLSQNAARSSKDVAHSVFELHTYVNEGLLFGLSPYFRHSSGLSIVNLYRATMWSVLLGALLFGGRGLLRRFRDGMAERSDFMLVGAVLLLLMIPIMPDTVNGATHFFIRMQVVGWILALFGASRIALSRRGSLVATAVSVAFAAVALLPAELLVRPAARQIAALDHLRLPEHTHGLMLLLESVGDKSKAVIPDEDRALAANIYVWSSMVPMLHAHDIPVNSPWLDATYLALGPGRDPDLLYNIVGNVREQQDIDQHDGDLRKITPEQRAQALAAADFVFAVRNDATQVDLSPQLGSLTNAFTCSTRDWYLLCLRNRAQIADN